MRTGLCYPRQILAQCVDLIIMAAIGKAKQLVHQLRRPRLVAGDKYAAFYEEMQVLLQALQLVVAARWPKLGLMPALTQHTREAGSGGRILDQTLIYPIALNHAQNRIAHLDEIKLATQYVDHIMEPIICGNDEGNGLTGILALL